MHGTPPILQLRELAYGIINTFGISVIAELKIADAIAEGHRTPAAIARRLDLHEQSVFRLLRFVSSLGVVNVEEDGGYSLSATGELLRTDIPGSFASMARVFGSGYSAATYADIAHSIRTGESAFEHAHGVGLFEYMQPRDTERQNFYSAFTGLSQSQAPAIAKAFDFQPFDTIVDIGGGYGYLLLEILKAYDHPRGILYDLEAVVADAAVGIEREGLSDRCTVESGSFFERVPIGGDAYVLKLILHDWPDDRAVEILSNCREAMAEDGRIIVVDMVVPSGPDYGLTLAADMNMMLLAGGLERSEEQFRQLCADSGLELVGVTPTETSLCVIEMKVG